MISAWYRVWLYPGSCMSRCITLSGGRKLAMPVVSFAAAESWAVRTESNRLRSVSSALRSVCG
jgi:hypothetical protein